VSTGTKWTSGTLPTTSNCGASPETWNGIKARYAFVDLLKPEREAVLPTLLVLDPHQADKVAAALPSVLRLGWDSIRRAFNFLGPGMDLTAGAGDRSPDARLLGTKLQETFKGAAVLNAEMPGARELLRRTEDRWSKGMTPSELLAAMPQPEFLGLRQMVLDILRRKSRSEVLREALEQVRKDTSFDRSVRDDTFKWLNKRIPRSIQFLVSGHTHLERALPCGRRNYYFNSGTWARLIGLTPEMLGSEPAFGPVYQAIERGGMADLDALRDLVVLRPAVVAFRVEESGTLGELCHAVDKGLASIEGTIIPRAKS
jgi:hypothetical protein